ncbi:MAG: ribonuclease H-like YkuK family protein [Candidatus Wolfebacteria bacterium]|nr:ribonuclease H-like YkuK family protein [Candidatus Wolfebacteria bacterium]
MDKLFNSSLGEKMNPRQIAREIIGFMKKDEARRYKIIIGSDSEGHNGSPADFVTAVVVHRVGNGGRYFWRRTEFGKFFNLHDRIIQEVILSIEVAQEILENLKSLNAPDFSFEIHVDVGEKGETKVMIQEVLGMVRAYNFEARVKPESYAASNVADRHV